VGREREEEGKMGTKGEFGLREVKVCCLGAWMQVVKEEIATTSMVTLIGNRTTSGAKNGGELLLL
jgi:hypothetical protein